MQTYNIKDFIKGWFCGNFEPSIIKTKDFEVAHQKYKKGNVSEPHYHTKSIEINYIIKGELIASSKKLKTGDFFVYEPNEVSNVQFLEDTDLIVVRNCSDVNDKINV